jgi:hypothetical protein
MLRTMKRLRNLVKITHKARYIVPDYRFIYSMIIIHGYIRMFGLNVKVTVVQALRLCTGRTAYRGSRGIALLFHDQRH